MAAKTSQRDDSHKIKQILTIVFLLLTFIMPVLGIVGVIFMWLWMKWRMWVKIIITVPFIIAFVFAPLMIMSYLFVMRPVQIQGEAMAPNYRDGQYYITKILSQNSEIKRGEVVIFPSPSSPDTDFIKRVIALPGEKILIKEGRVYVNGTLLDESAYLTSDIITEPLSEGLIKEGEEFIIPANSYFVMGDNRPRSQDSRAFGPISRESIRSRVAFCYFGCK